MDEKEEILYASIEAIEEYGSGVACEKSAVVKNEEDWLQVLEGFIWPWAPGNIDSAANARNPRTFRHGVWNQLKSVAEYC